jgi:hypothetical protein
MKKKTASHGRGSFSHYGFRGREKTLLAGINGFAANNIYPASASGHIVRHNGHEFRSATGRSGSGVLSWDQVFSGFDIINAAGRAEIMPGAVNK